MDNQGYNGEDRFYTQGKLQPTRSFGQRHLWKIIASVAIALVLVFAVTTITLLARFSQKPSPNPVQASVVVTSSTPTQTLPVPTPTPTTVPVSPTAAGTPTSVATPGLPCSVDLSTWTGGSPDWVVHNSVLYNDGSNGSNNGPTIIAPCQPGVANYTVEAKIQVTNSSNGCFGLVFRGSSTQNGWQGYKADICGLNTAYISAYGDYGALTQAPFTPGTTAHTYRVDVQDNAIKFFIDGNLVDTTTDNRLLTTETGQGVGLYSQNVQLQVTSFQVMAVS